MINNDKNLNNDFYEDLDTNFENALNLADKDFSHEELIRMLKNGNIPEKQIAALKFDCVNDENDSAILLNNLTGCDGKIREAVALKIYQTIKTQLDTQKFFSINSAKIFADASIDINANICRLVVDSVTYLKSNKNFAMEYTSFIVNYAKDALSELDKFIFRDKKYVINKQIFKLYWCLETLKNFYEFVDEETINMILLKSSEQKEYTVREKVAEISILSDKFKKIRQSLKDDENYYVRNILLNH